MDVLGGPVQDLREPDMYDDPEMIADSIDALCEDDMATLRTNISRIRKKIRDKAGDWASQRYGVRKDEESRYFLDVQLREEV